MLVRSLAGILLFAATVDGGMPPGKPRMPAPAAKDSTAPKTVAVDCTKGESVQDAVDKNAGPVEIAISGTCLENVLIREKDVTLRGTDPTVDGITSPTADAAAVTMLNVVAGRLENLAFSNNPRQGVSIRFSNATLTNCRIENNAAAGLQVTGPGTVVGESLIISTNQGRGANIASGAQFFCIACEFAGNLNFAAAAGRGALLSLLQSTVTGRRGVFASETGSYADIDCFSEPGPHPCSMLVTGIAASAIGGATAALYAAGDFTGSVLAQDRGAAYLLGARQLALAQPGHGPSTNIAGSLSTFHASAFFDFDPPEESSLRATEASHFARVLVTEQTTLNGAITCSSAADAWLDPTIVAGPGAAVSGCEHGSLPPP